MRTQFELEEDFESEESEPEESEPKEFEPEEEKHMTAPSKQAEDETSETYGGATRSVDSKIARHCFDCDICGDRISIRRRKEWQ